MDHTAFSFQPIGVIHSPCKEKFGVPRQGGLVAQLTAHIEIFPPFDRDEAFTGMQQYSHIWVISIFHQALRDAWQPTVRPPRLGGNQRMGVFATRAPYRPNPLGLSVFPLLGQKRDQGRLQLHVAGCDLVEGTPVLDVKPYLPYADCIPSARDGFTLTHPRQHLQVSFTAQAEQQCQQLAARYPGLCELVRALLAEDPRPAYQQAPRKDQYGMRLYDLNVRFSVTDSEACVQAIEPL